MKRTSFPISSPACGHLHAYASHLCERFDGSLQHGSTCVILCCDGKGLLFLKLSYKICCLGILCLSGESWQLEKLLEKNREGEEGEQMETSVRSKFTSSLGATRGAFTSPSVAASKDGAYCRIMSASACRSAWYTHTSPSSRQCGHQASESHLRQSSCQCDRGNPPPTATSPPRQDLQHHVGGEEIVGQKMPKILHRDRR